MNARVSCPVSARACVARRRPWAVLLLVATATVLRAAAPGAAESPLDAEETYEMRLERLLDAKGHAALVAHLEAELKQRPRSYVKAWYANYLLYGAAFGMPKVADPVRGFRLAQESADEGSLFGLELVGRAYCDGTGTERNPALAVKLVRQAAERGRDSAMAALGQFYFFGQGVPLDRHGGEEWIRKAAFLGATGPLLTLAGWWEDARYVGQPDHAKALRLYYEAGEAGNPGALQRLHEWARQGDPLAQQYVHLDLVVSAVRGYDALPSRLKAAVAWLGEHCADDVAVQVALAEVMIERTLPVYDVKAARAKLMRGVAAGDQDARAIQADLAWRGVGQPADQALAVAVWRDLAQAGNARALNQIGWLHYWGNGEKFGLPKDPAQAFALCKRAADLGYWAAQLNVAACYAHGIGVPVNYHLAAKYYDILEKRRYKDARRMKARILSMVTD